MYITNITQLISKKDYWYISVPQCCHFSNLKVKHFVYKGNPNSLYGMIIFDSESDANAFLCNLKNIINPMMLP